jgi:hypothetical protein
MRKLEGKVTFGGSIGYCPQTAWIQNATLVSHLAAGWCFTNTQLSHCSATMSSLDDPSMKIAIGMQLKKLHCSLIYRFFQMVI